MQFICNSKIMPGVSREEVIEHLNLGPSAEAWDVIKKGIVTQWMYKVGEEPGVVLFVSGDYTVEEVHELLDIRPSVSKGLIEFVVDPISPFSHFD